MKAQREKQRIYYQYNNLNQLTHKTVCDLTSYIEDSHEYRYTYDKRGNLVLEENCERTTQGNKWLREAAYEYNAANRLAVGTNEKGEKSVYTFNGLGQRVRNEYIVQDNGYDYTTFDCTPPSVEVDFEKPEVVVRDFVIDQTSPIQEVLVDSEKDGFDYRYTVGLDRISVHVLSPDPNTNHERTQTATKQWLHSDRLGSTVNSTDSFGRVTERTDYNEWGKITFHEPIRNTLGYRAINTDLTYTNHDYDVVLEMYYAKARMYDPLDKRFTQADPIKGFVDTPASLVNYTYVQNNPLKYIDLLGLIRQAAKIFVNGKAYSGYNDNSTVFVNQKDAILIASEVGVVLPLGLSDVPVRQIAQLSGALDTLSWWQEYNNTTVVTFNPDMHTAPVKVIRSGNSVNIDIYAQFSGVCDIQYNNVAEARRLAKLPDSGGTRTGNRTDDKFNAKYQSTYTYAELFALRVVNNWKGHYNNQREGKKYYDLFGKCGMDVYVNFYSDREIGILGKGTPVKGQRYISVNIDNRTPESFDTPHISATYNAGLSWTIENSPTYVRMYDHWIGTSSSSGKKTHNEYDVATYMSVAAHEFGHVMGIGDAYQTWRHSAAPENREIPRDDMMRTNNRVTANDIEMILYAYQHNQWQEFVTGESATKSPVVRLT